MSDIFVNQWDLQPRLAYLPRRHFASSAGQQEKNFFLIATMDHDGIRNKVASRSFKYCNGTISTNKFIDNTTFANS